MPFEGLIASAYTPFAATGRINALAVPEMLKLYRESGVFGVMVGGVAGEGHSLTIAERRGLCETWAGAGEGLFPVFAHIGHECLADAIELARQAERAGVAAVAAMAPIAYGPRSVEDLIEYLAPIAEAAGGLPFYFYDAPAFNSVHIAPDHLLEWGSLRVPSLAGVILANPDARSLQSCLPLASRFRVLCADEGMLSGLAHGITCAVGASFNYAAPVYRRMLDRFERGDVAAARDAQTQATELFRIMREFGTLRAGKAIMSLVGVDCGDVRPPLRALTVPEFRQLHERVRHMEVFARPLGTPEELGR